ncbi:S9 family peptidase [Pontixanthobacter sp. CEM42]|uniref:alpha/beta hydrolase family protein n=1 Tax=Pontixanthobacter sp. CEM42 TaxID=2792077 RepID=UPI001AE02948|nr:S9 family peptidase [Pontixanthobacter sp. CEM42]
MLTAAALLLGNPATAQDDAGTVEASAPVVNSAEVDAEAQSSSEPIAAPIVEPDRRPKLIPTSAFASRSQIFDAELSPDGSKFAYRLNSDGRARIAIFDAATRRAIRTIDVGEAGTARWFRWAGNNRLLFTLRTRALLGFRSIAASRLMVHDLVTEQTHPIGLSNRSTDGGDVLHVDPQGQFALLSMGENTFSDPSVFRFPLDGSGEEAGTLVQARENGIDQWWADHNGVIRLGLKRAGERKLSYYYRAGADEEFVHVTKASLGEEAIDKWDILSIAADGDIGQALVEDERGFSVLREFDFRTGTAGELIYANPDWGLESAYVDEKGAVLGAEFVDDIERYEWFDQDLARHQNRLQRSLGEGAVRILSRSADGTRMLVWHGGGSDPGVVYVYTPGRNKLDVFGELRPDVDHKQLSPPQPITYSARDGTQISGYLTLPRERGSGNFPLIVNPHGGPYGIRSTMTYDDEVQMLANRGYAVLQPNFRGSDGFGRAFAELGYGQIGRAMQDDIDDATDWAIAQGYADPERICVVGGSYGGYTSLWAVIRNPERYRCAASWAGVMDFEAQRKHTREKLPRRSRKDWNDKIVGGDIEFSFDDVSPVQQIERLTKPVLLAHGKYDGIVPFSQFTAMRQAAEENDIPVETLVFDDEGHALSEMVNEQAWYDALLAFLAKENPADFNTPEIVEEQAKLAAERAEEAEAARKAEEERLAAEAERNANARKKAGQLMDAVAIFSTQAGAKKRNAPAASPVLSVEDSVEIPAPE